MSQYSKNMEALICLMKMKPPCNVLLCSFSFAGLAEYTINQCIM